MGFNRSAVAELLAECRRRCCICHRFCGVKIETDHIEPAADGGGDQITNAIPVCFNCHAEIHSYNDRHPRGRKFTPDELRRHKEQWLDYCGRNPARLPLEETTLDAAAGPLQALIDEIDFNLAAAKVGAQKVSGCPLRDELFSRALAAGSISVLDPELKDAIHEAYVAVGHASVLAKAAVARGAGGAGCSVSGNGSGDPSSAMDDCIKQLNAARDQLLKFLGHGGIDAGSEGDKGQQ